MADAREGFGLDVMACGTELFEGGEGGGWIDRFVVGSDDFEEWRSESFQSGLRIIKNHIGNGRKLPTIFDFGIHYIGKLFHLSLAKIFPLFEKLSAFAAQNFRAGFSCRYTAIKIPDCRFEFGCLLDEFRRYPTFPQGASCFV